MEKIRNHVESVLNNVRFTTDIMESVQQCDLVIEAIPEDVELKRTMFRKIDQVSNLN